MTRNLRTTRDVPPEENRNEKIKIQGLSSFQEESKRVDSLHPTDPGYVWADRTHKLIDRLTREREDKERQGKEESPSLPQAERANEGEDLNPYMEFSDRLLELRDRLLEAAAAAARIKTVGNIADKATATATNAIQHTLIKPPPDQPIDFLIPFLSPPKIDVGNTTTIILVPSHQGSFVKRQAIRETWKAATKNHTSVTVLFVVAQSDCQEFDSDLDANTGASNTTNSSLTCDEIDHSFLNLEQERNEDLLEIPMKEEYDRLPEKMMQAYNWALKNIPNLKWVAKADDDMFVDVQNLEKYVKKYNFEVPMVIGEIVYHSPVAKQGKWAEFDYAENFYPYWPKGSAGHVLSRTTVEYITENSESLHRYQGEDTSIGIWLHEARISGRLDDLTYIDAPQSFVSGGISVCEKGKNAIIMVGHQLNPSRQMLCLKAASNSGSLGNSWNDAPSNFEELIEEEEERRRGGPEWWRR